MAGERSGPARRVAWVTGASRGVGKGIAAALGGAGWVVYVTARSAGGQRSGHLPGTVEATAEMVTRAGGAGDPARLTLTGRALTVDELATRYRIDVTS